MSKRHFISFLLMLVFALGCERRPLVDVYNTHYVRVYIDESLLNVTEGFYNEDHQKPHYNSPGIIRVALADPESGNIIAERYLRNMGEDEKGRYYDGYVVANPGHYHLIAYNFDTESTIMLEAGNLFTIKATTNGIASNLYSRIPSRVKGPSMTETIVYDPNHTFVVDCGDVVVPYVEQLDTLRTPEGEYFHGKSIVKSYYLQVNVKGMEYVTSSVALLNGMAGSVNLHERSINLDDEVTVYFEMLKSDSQDNEGLTTIYATFNTFGKLPDREANLEITFDFLTTYGAHHSEKFEISEKFNEPDAIEHQWIILDKTITIPDPPAPEPGTGGGFVPDVGPWDDVNTDIYI